MHTFTQRYDLVQSAHLYYMFLDSRKVENLEETYTDTGEHVKNHTDNNSCSGLNWGSWDFEVGTKSRHYTALKKQRDYHRPLLSIVWLMVYFQYISICGSMCGPCTSDSCTLEVGF